MKAVTPVHSSKTGENFLDHLRTPGWFARWPIIGILLFISGTLVFSSYAYNLQIHGPLIQTDLPIANSLHAVALASPGIVLQLMIFGSFLGREMIVLAGLALGLYFFYKRFWPELAMVIVGLMGGEFLFEVLSRYFDRHRPVFSKPVWEVLTVPGFPSGHSISAVLLYGLLAYLLVPKIPTRFWKAVVILIAILIIAYIGFSRVFTGDHYLSDVLSGYALGLAWGGLVYTSIEWFTKRNSNRLRRPG